MSKNPPTAEAGSTERLSVMGVVVHLLAIPLALFGPGLMYAITGDGFANANARNALNWQLLVVAVVIGSVIAIFTVGAVIDLVFFLGVLIALAVLALNVVFCLVATYKAVRGEAWRYPGAPEFV